MTAGLVLCILLGGIILKTIVVASSYQLPPLRLELLLVHGRKLRMGCGLELHIFFVVL
jgi:hypothetical protein